MTRTEQRTAGAAPKRRKASGSRRRTLAIAGLAALILITVFAVARTRGNTTSGRLITGQVTRGDLIETVSATGSVNAQTGAEVKIGSQITGRIKRLNADVGSYVKAGQVIAELDLPDLQAQLDQSNANYAQAMTHYAQQVAGVTLERSQTSNGVLQAQAGALSARAKLSVADANLQLQTTATPTDIAKAQTGLAVARSALSTAQSNLKQVQAAANLAIVDAKEGLTQAQANAAASAVAETRLRNLVAKGYAPQAQLDSAHALAVVNASQVRSAEETIRLTTEKAADDVQTARDQLTEAQQSLLASQAALRAAQAETNTVQARKADVRDAQTTIQQAEAALRLAQAARVNDTLKQQDVRASQQAVAQAKAQVAFNQAQLDKALIKSPISGTVLQLSAQQGETLAAGLSAPTLIVVADLTRLQVDAYVDETDIGKVALGQKARVTVDAFPNRTFDGTVQKIASGSTIQQGVVTYDVTVAIKDPSHVLKPDMTANVDIETGKLSNVLLVPAVAVQTGTRGSTVNVLRTVDGRREVVPVQVVTGGTDGVDVEIVKGLNEGERIALAGQAGPTRTAPSPFGPRGGSGAGGGGGGR